MRRAVSSTWKVPTNAFEDSGEIDARIVGLLLSMLDSSRADRDAVDFSGVDVEFRPDAVLFSIQGLHAYLSARCDRIAQLDALMFQRALYRSNLNEALSHRGVTIEVAENRGKVGLNRYRLRAQN